MSTVRAGVPLHWQRIPHGGLHVVEMPLDAQQPPDVVAAALREWLVERELDVRWH